MRLLLSLEVIHKCKVILIGVRHFRSAGASMIFPFCQPQSYLPGTGCTAITKAVGPEWGLSIALRLGWPLRSPQMLVTRVRNFYVGGTAFALSPEKRRITVLILIGWRNFKIFVHKISTGSTVLCCRDACVCTCAKRLKRHLKFSTPLYGQIIPKKKTQKVSVTWCSQAVTHPSTNHALLCLTSVIGRELVLSQWYERWQ